NDSDFSGNFSIFKSIYDYNSGYVVDSEGINIGVGHRFSRFISGYLGYGYSRNSYTFDSSLDLSTIDTFYFEDYAKSSVTISGKFDNTDDYYLPREGFTLSQSFEKAGIDGDANFLKSRTSFSKFYGLKDYLSFDAIFRYKSRLNMIIDNGYIPIAEKFHMGGIGSVRGYESYSLSSSITDTKGVVRKIGSRQTFSNNIEISLPLVPKAKMRLVTYLDWGFIGDDSLNEISRGGYGAGIEWFSPVGPIQLMFSNPLQEETGDRISHFDFMMGRRF
ncbi:MAG: BamA/TamA family outer membrane protein, partial [Campylobacterota bacterium]|nr:BamA/TamA family outer membrane protein [Campylobacterota bacterium]